MPVAEKTGALFFKKLILWRPREDHRTREFLEVAGFLEENDEQHININDPLDLYEQELFNTDHKA